MYIKSLSIFCVLLQAEWKMTLGGLTNLSSRERRIDCSTSYDDDYSSDIYRSALACKRYGEKGVNLNAYYLLRTDSVLKFGLGITTHGSHMYMGRFNKIEEPAANILLFGHFCFALVYETKFVNIMFTQSVASLSYDPHMSDYDTQIAQTPLERKKIWSLVNDIFSVHSFKSLMFYKTFYNMLGFNIGVYLQFMFLNTRVNGSSYHVAFGIDMANQSV